MQEHGFLHQALVYLAAGVIAVPLFKRLGLGYGKVAARRVITSFRRHDEQGLLQQAKHRKDTKKLIMLAQQGRQDLEQLLATEAARRS